MGKHAGAAPTLTLTSIVAGFNAAEVQCYSFSGTDTVRESHEALQKPLSGFIMEGGTEENVLRPMEDMGGGRSL